MPLLLMWKRKNDRSSPFTLRWSDCQPWRPDSDLWMVATIYSSLWDLGRKCKGKQAITVHPSKEQTKLQYFFKKKEKKKNPLMLQIQSQIWLGFVITKWPLNIQPCDFSKPFIVPISERSQNEWSAMQGLIFAVNKSKWWEQSSKMKRKMDFRELWQEQNPCQKNEWNVMRSFSSEMFFWVWHKLRRWRGPETVVHFKFDFYEFLQGVCGREVIIQPLVKIVFWI